MYNVLELHDKISEYNKIDINHKINLDNDNFRQIINKDDFFDYITNKNININNNNNEILKQFLIDFNRQDMFINNEKIDNIFIVLEHIYNHISKKNPDLFNNILHLSQQTSVFFPISIIYKLINPSYIIAEKNKESQNNRMKIYLNNDYIKLIKNMRLVNEDLQEISMVKFIIIFDIINNKIIIDYLFENPDTKYGFEIL